MWSNWRPVCRGMPRLVEILASLDALGPHANFFELGPSPPHEAGTGVRVAGMHVSCLGRGSATRRFEATAQRGLTPFIGRGEIVAFLKDFLAADHPATRRCAVVVGGPGLGKTRLLEEVVGQCDGGVFWLAAWQLSRAGWCCGGLAAIPADVASVLRNTGGHAGR